MKTITELRKEAEKTILNYMNRRNSFGVHIIDCDYLGYCLIEYQERWIVTWVSVITLACIQQESLHDKK